MENILFDLYKVRMEISFKTFDELRDILSFYDRNNLLKVNIPCKSGLKKDFLLNSIRIAKQEFPRIDIVPHYSILHEFRRKKQNTLDSFIKFLQVIRSLGCKEVLLVSGSQKRSTLDSVSTLSSLKNHPAFEGEDVSIGVAFNPYLPDFLFEEEILRLKKKLQSGLVSSIWIQFGTDYKLLKSRIKILKNILDSYNKINTKESNIMIFGSILIPSKQFLARFKYRPWKGVYCSSEFLNSVEIAKNILKKILITYKRNNISPIIETGIYTDNHLENLKNNIFEKNAIVK